MLRRGAACYGAMLRREHQQSSIFPGLVTLLRRTDPRGAAAPTLSATFVDFTSFINNFPSPAFAIPSDPEQSRLKTLLDNQHPTRKNKGQLK